MIITSRAVEQHNEIYIKKHEQEYSFIKSSVPHAENIISKLIGLQIAIPSWALGSGGTRFGRFSIAGEPRSLEEKIEDVGLLHSLNKSSGAISLHIPWDIPTDVQHIKACAAQVGIKFDAVNSNTFQDQPEQDYSYKFGSLSHINKSVRQQAINHNLEVIEYGKQLGSESITIWLADGSSFPGQLNFRNAFQLTLESLQQIYSALPVAWKMFIEYKAFEPNFYSMTVGDWGQSLLYANKLGAQAYTLVDLGHHLPNANIEQIVSLLMMEGKLGGFHFNDSKYGDDDLTVGSINPYQLFLIFCQLVEGMDNRKMNHSTDMSWMIDASHNIKDPLEDLLQSVEAIKLAYAQALLVDQVALSEAQLNNDVTLAQEIMQQAFRTDVRPLLAEARLRSGGALRPIVFFRDKQLRKTLVTVRGTQTFATGL